MIRPQRRVHAVLWPLLGAVLVIGIAASLWVRGGDPAKPVAHTNNMPPGVRP